MPSLESRGSPPTSGGSAHPRQGRGRSRPGSRRLGALGACRRLVSPMHAAAPVLVTTGSVSPVCAAAPCSLPPSTATYLPPVPAAPITSIVEVCPEPSAEDGLLALEIQLHIAINVVSHLNSAEEARSLSIEEQSLREFLLDQILFLQESLEPWLVPRIIEELLGHERVAAPPLDKDIP
jgi:hypothetical protein